jgi:hypothetical protein
MEHCGPEARLGPQETAILRALANGKDVRVTSTQRLRFEMLGLIHDTADGVKLTPQGRKLLSEQLAAPLQPAIMDMDAKVKRDVRGRRLGNQRQFFL